jgi:tripartite-type tricarboxylate transporter receptor subunit TctC
MAILFAARAAFIAVATLAVAIVAGASASAQDGAGNYPDRPVTIVVPYAAGGGLDVFARQLAQRLSDRLGKPFVVENRPGAGTVIGASYVAKAAPDGYTLMLGTSSPFAINVTLNKALPYDPGKVFAPIIHTSDAPFLLLVHPDVPAKTVGEWIKYVKAQPKPPSYGTAGPGSPQHLSMELLKSLTGTKLTHVPYRGDAPALNDLVAGHIPTQFAQPTPALPLLRASKIRALAVSSKMRLGPMPDLPTLAEAGVAGFDFVSWQMIVAPAGTPKDIVAKLHRELKAIIASPDVQQEYVKTGRIAVDSPPPDELLKFMRNEIVRLGKVVESAGIARSQ